MTADTRHRLDGLEPDNLLAFLALLGLLRALEIARPDWTPRAHWDIAEPPLCPFLTIAEPGSREAVCEAAAAGATTLLAAVDFEQAANLKLSREGARKLLDRAAAGKSDAAGRFFADLCAALVSDAALARDGSGTAPTPLSYPKVARVNFLDGLRTISDATLPEQKNRTRDPQYPKSAADCIAQTLFAPWDRLDRPAGLRWDPDEAKRHAYQWNAPTDEQPRTQHGANRLAIVGLSALTAVPAGAGSDVRLSVIGGRYDANGFSFAWPISKTPVSFAGLRALLSHPMLREPRGLRYFGVDHVRVARRISLGKYRNFTYAGPL